MPDYDRNSRVVRHVGARETEHKTEELRESAEAVEAAESSLEGSAASEQTSAQTASTQTASAQPAAEPAAGSASDAKAPATPREEHTFYRAAGTSAASSASSVHHTERPASNANSAYRAERPASNASSAYRTERTAPGAGASGHAASSRYERPASGSERPTGHASYGATSSAASSHTHRENGEQTRISRARYDSGSTYRSRENEVDAEPFLRDRSDDDGDGRKPWSTTKKVVVAAVSALLVILLAVGIKYVVDIMNPASLFQDDILVTPTPEDSTPTPEAAGTDAGTETEPTPTPTPDADALLSTQADLSFMKNRVNILLLGIDESTERESWGSFRTDTMILVTINFDTNDVDMISVPRDSYIKLYSADGTQYTDSDGNGVLGKANSAFSKGGGAKKKGYESACMTVSKLLGGVPINYYVGFNMNVVKQVVDAMGGVDYYVDINVKMNGRTLSIGQQHLDGQAVLDYCRMRKGSSDIARVERQQNMLKAIFKQLKDTNQIQNIPSIYQAVESNIQTNLSFTQISSLALLALHMDTSQLTSHTVEGGFLNTDASYWGINTAKLKKLVKSVFGIDMTEDPDIDIDNIKANIEANRAAIATELATAEALVTQCETVLTNYGALMDSAAKTSLESAKKDLEDAIEAEEKTQLDTATAALQSLVNAALLQYEPTAVATPTPDPFSSFTGGITGFDPVVTETPSDTTGTDTSGSSFFGG